MRTSWLEINYCIYKFEIFTFFSYSLPFYPKFDASCKFTSKEGPGARSRFVTQASKNLGTYRLKCEVVGRDGGRHAKRTGVSPETEPTNPAFFSISKDFVSKACNKAAQSGSNKSS